MAAGGHFDFNRLRRWREQAAPPERWGRHRTEDLTRPTEASIAIGIADGEALTGRAIARMIHVGESTLRGWRRASPAFHAELCAAIERGQQRRAEREAERLAAEEAAQARAQLWATPGAWAAKQAAEMADLERRGLISY